MWMRKSTAGNKTKSRSKSSIPFVEISFPLSALGASSAGFPQRGQLQALLGISDPHSEHLIHTIPSRPFVSRPSRAAIRPRARQPTRTVRTA